jgi:putative transposase
MNFRRGSHSIYKTEYHVVWTPRYRRKLFVPGVKEYAEDALRHVEKLAPDIEVVSVNAQPDHIHMVTIIPPRIAVASAIGYIKQRTAVALKTKFPFMKKAYWGVEGIWSDGYCVSGIGLDESEILSYVEKQGMEDSGQLQFKL